MRPRGIENLLLRRVRRHRSMTALFRAPDIDSGRTRLAQTPPVIQKKEEQDSLVDVPMTEVKPSLPVSPAPPITVTRQVAPPLASLPKPLSPLPSSPTEPEPAKMPDPVWKRLQTIFRKHQDNPPAKDREVSVANPLHSQTAHDEEIPEAPQALSADEPALSVQKPTTSIPTAKTVQRSSEDVKPKSELLSSNIQPKAQLLSSVPSEPAAPAAVRSAEDKPTLPMKTVEVNDPVSTDREIEKLSLPLESAWNVQRLEASHPLFQENIPDLPLDSRAADKNETSIETTPVSEQRPNFGPIQLQQEGGSTVETQVADSPQGGSREPVEILSPSRPRPPQADAPPKSMSIQRQSEENHAAKKISEAASVSTAIGPLPADLWWLLGQKPPSETPVSGPDIQRVIHSDQQQARSDQHRIANPSPTPVEPPAEPILASGTVQRQALSQDSLPSSRQEPDSLPRAEESKPTETPDLDDLARRVYAEVRRRLAAEWERRR